MICYSYNQQVQPPAPLVHVAVRCPETAKSATDLPALLDTAADRSVIPGALVLDLPVAGFGGQVLMVRTYRVELEVRGLSTVLVEVFAHDE